MDEPGVERVGIGTREQDVAEGRIPVSTMVDG